MMMRAKLVHLVIQGLMDEGEEGPAGSWSWTERGGDLYIHPQDGSEYRISITQTRSPRTVAGTGGA